MPIHDLAAPALSRDAVVCRAVERWFRRHQRPLPWRRAYDPFRVWVSEVMAQQTRLEVVVPYFERFIEKFPTIAALAAATDDEVTAAWSGLGYYRRARMLRAGAIDVCARFGGELPRDAEALQTIAGIGPYTAGAIASIAFERPAAIVDGNIARLFSRLFAIDEPAASPALLRAAWAHAADLVRNARSPRNLNQGLMEIGALICTPRNPSCLLCPLADGCEARAKGLTGNLPRPRAKMATRELRISLYLVIDRNGRLLMRRETGPLMNAMFHLPHGNASLLGGTPMHNDAATRVGSFRHTVTNHRITFEVFRSPLAGRRSPGYEWIDPGELSAVPHPSYVRKALRLAGI